MSETFHIVKELVNAGKFRVSQHGDEEMREDALYLTALLNSLSIATVVEDYPDAWKGPSVLLLQEFEGMKFHAIWGLSKSEPNIATIITAYVPDTTKWNTALTKRSKP